MELLNNLIEDPFWLIIVIFWIFFAGFWFLRRQQRAFKFAEFVTEKGQFELIRKDVLNEAINDAQKQGNKDQFLQLLTQVRRTYGHDGVKLGHLYWIWRMIEEDELSPKHIPDFKFEFLPLKISVLNEAIKDAKSQGNKEHFLRLLAQIRHIHGHDSVKMGHLKWIWDMINNNDIKPKIIPTFTSKDQ